MLLVKINTVKAKIDKSLCIGCALCCDLAPASFQMDDELKSEAKEEVIADETKAREAADSCPVKAITLK